MSKYTDDLKTLILEHEHVIQNYEARIEDLTDDVAEAQITLIRSQLEFFALNVRGLKQSKEQELERALALEAYEVNPAFMPGPAFVVPPRPSAIPWPDPPTGAVSRVIFGKVDTPGFMLLMHRFFDGRLVPCELTETWTPNDKWALMIEEPIIDAEFTGDRPDSTDAQTSGGVAKE